MMNVLETTGGLLFALFAALLGALFVVGLIAAWSQKAGEYKQMEHAERMKALEMGVSPQGRLGWPAAAVCIAIGAGVPIGSFVVAWLATLTAGAPHAIWVAPVFVSFAAIGAARKLAHRIIDPRSKPKSKKPAPGKSTPIGKPEFDPDAFDVVGSRG